MAILRLVVAVALFAFCVRGVHAADRIALVIGNNDYVQVADLKKAANDADAISSTLTEIGYEVLVARDATRREMNLQLQLFASRLKPGDEALFYFAGHGVEINGRNYLLPTDIPSVGAGQEDFITAEAIPVDIILDQIKSRGTRVSILILDACRDNPFPKNGTRSLGSARGLTRTIAPEGSFIMYSAGVGQTALDRLSNDDVNPNSVFTRSLIPLLKKPNMSLVQTARQVRLEVQKLATTISHNQRPAYYDEVTGDFYFNSNGVIIAEPASPKPTNAAAQAWAAIEDTNSKAILQVFVERFPDSLYAEFAQARIREIEKDVVALLRPESPIAPKINEQVPENECDLLAASPNDPNALSKGVEIDNLNSELAIPACTRAIADYPTERRFAFQLARAQHAAKEYSSALKIYEKLANDDYRIAQHNLGFMYENGLGVSKDDAEAVKWYRSAAEQNYALAQFNLGVMFSQGRGVSKNDVEAVKWYRKAVEQDNANALHELGNMFADGRGLIKDEAKALDLYRKAAGLNLAVAKLSLGIMYLNGRGVINDDAEASKWFSEAVAQNNANAKIFLGFMYESGRGVSKNDIEAVKLYSEAAEQNEPMAMFSLGRMYNLGKGGLNEDEIQGASLVATAIKSGIEYSEFFITQMNDNPEAYPKKFRVELQRILRDAGVYDGALDGKFGAATTVAIKRHAGAS